MPNMASLLEPCRDIVTSPAVDTAAGESRQAVICAGPAAGEMSLESSMTGDSGRADVHRLGRQRRHRGADDVFPTHALHRYQVRVEFYLFSIR